MARLSIHIEISAVTHRVATVEEALCARGDERLPRFRSDRQHLFGRPDFADKVLKASDKWNENIHAYAHIVQPDGKRYIQADQITDSLARDKYGIAFSRYRGDRPGVRRVRVAISERGPFVEHTLESVQDRSYPLHQ